MARQQIGTRDRSRTYYKDSSDDGLRRAEEELKTIQEQREAAERAYEWKRLELESAHASLRHREQEIGEREMSDEGLSDVSQGEIIFIKEIGFG